MILDRPQEESRQADQAATAEAATSISGRQMGQFLYIAIGSRRNLGRRYAPTGSAILHKKSRFPGRL